MSFMKSGPEGAKIILVGEAPGKAELRSNAPFIGPSGYILDQCLHTAGIARVEVLILNLFSGLISKSADGKKYFLGGSLVYDGKNFYGQGKKDVAALISEIISSKANVVCPLGSAALQALFGDSRILKWRGSILKGVGDKKLVPSIHPTFILRGQQHFRHVLSSDLKRVREEASSPEIKLPQRKFIINPSLDESLEYTRYAQSTKKIATDIEILNKQISCFSIATSPYEAISIPLLDEFGHQRWDPDEEAEIWRAMALLLGDSSVTKINQNLLFDLQVYLQRNKLIPSPPYVDIMSGHKILYPEFPADLGFLCSVYTRQTYYKDDRKLWQRPDKDPHAFWTYNARDATSAFAVWEGEDGAAPWQSPMPGLRSEIEDGSFKEKTFQMTMDNFHPLMYIMTSGLKMSTESLQEARRKLNLELQELEKKLSEVSERPFNPNSPAQCKEYFYGHKGYHQYVSQKTGNVAVDELALTRIVRRYNDRAAQVVLQIRNTKKLLGTYLEIDLDEDNRLRSSMHPLTRFGRLASSKTLWGTGMNQQNLDPRFTQFIIPG